MSQSPNDWNSVLTEALDSREETLKTIDEGTRKIGKFIATKLRPAMFRAMGAIQSRPGWSVDGSEGDTEYTMKLSLRGKDAFRYVVSFISRPEGIVGFVNVTYWGATGEKKSQGFSFIRGHEYTVDVLKVSEDDILQSFAEHVSSIMELINQS